MHQPPLYTLILVLLVAITASACTPISSTATAVGGGVLAKEVNRLEFEEDVTLASQEYLRDHADSPCTDGEDRVIPGLVEFVKDAGPSGIDDAIERFQTIHEDTSQPAEVRASALYHIAVIYFRRPDNPNPYLAVNQLKQIRSEFPGMYDCIFADTPWRREMQRKLNIPDSVIPKDL